MKIHVTAPSIRNFSGLQVRLFSFKQYYITKISEELRAKEAYFFEKYLLKPDSVLDL